MKSFVCEEDTKGDVMFRWMLMRALAKCKRECADPIWKQRPKSVPQAIALMKEWEHKYGSAVKVWVRKPEVVADKKAGVTTMVLGRKEPEKPWSQGLAKVKTEKEVSNSAYARADLGFGKGGGSF